MCISELVHCNHVFPKQLIFACTRWLLFPFLVTPLCSLQCMLAKANLLINRWLRCLKFSCYLCHYILKPIVLSSFQVIYMVKELANIKCRHVCLNVLSPSSCSNYSTNCLIDIHYHIIT